MRLGIRMLNNSSTMNTLMYQNQVTIAPGETYTVMFQLIDLDQQDAYYQKCPIRYIPNPGAAIVVNLISINQANNLTYIPSQPFSQDGSIWQFTMTAANTTIAAGVNMNVTLTQGSQVAIARAPSVLVIQPPSPYSC